jgi:hypothetical protein
VYASVCVRERDRERENVRAQERLQVEGKEV